MQPPPHIETSDIVSIENVTKLFKKKNLNKKSFTIKSYLLKQKNSACSNHAGGEESFVALKKVTFSIKKGETLGIIGRNGSGKSTLLKVIAGIMQPTEGQIIKSGRVATLIELGAGFHPEFTGRENLFINANILGIPMNKIKQIYDEIVAFSGIEDFMDNPVKTYSSGMYMRLAFSVAIHVNPDILIIDEILGVGDKLFQHKCKSVLNDFKRRGKTLIIVSHDIESIKNTCSRVVYLEKGELVCQGEPKEVIQKYMLRIRELEEEEMQKEEERAGQARHESKKRTEGKTNEDSLFTDEENTDEVLSEMRKRWGEREIEILAVNILSGDCKKKHVFVTGEPVSILMKYKVNTPVENMVFGVGIHKDDGLLCFGTNTDIDNFKLKDIGGEGTVEFKIDSLSLLPGTYFIDVAVHDEDGIAYDYHRHLHSFVMDSDVTDVGVYRPRHQWSISSLPEKLSETLS